MALGPCDMEDLKQIPRLIVSAGENLAGSTTESAIDFQEVMIAACRVKKKIKMIDPYITDSLYEGTTPRRNLGGSAVGSMVTAVPPNLRCAKNAAW